MSLRRRNPVFVGALTLFGVIALAEAGLIYERWSASRAAEAKLAQRQADLAGMGSLMPAPTREIAAEIETDLARAQRALAAMQGELKGRGPAAEKLRSAKVPAARTDSFFDLATYTERMRELARKHEVRIRPDAARFGFAAYANEAPEAERLEPVFRQRQITQFLVEALLEAKPFAILGVKREPTLTKPEKEARDAALIAVAEAIAQGQPPPDPSASGAPTIELPEGPDYFIVDSRVSARVPGFIDTSGFRLVFTGQTAALRTLLNRLAAFELPVLVREVEVEPATAEDAAEMPEENAADSAADPAAAAASAASVVLALEPAPKPVAKTAPPRNAPRGPVITPIVAKPLSKFTVTVEFVDLVPPPAPPAEGAVPNS